MPWLFFDKVQIRRENLHYYGDVKCVLRHVYSDAHIMEVHYYVDRYGTVHYACVKHIFSCARVTHTESGGWKYLRRGIRNDYWFSARSNTFSFLLALSDYRSPSYHRRLFMSAYWNLPSTICHRGEKKNVLRAFLEWHARC